MTLQLKAGRKTTSAPTVCGNALEAFHSDRLMHPGTMQDILSIGLARFQWEQVPDSLPNCLRRSRDVSRHEGVDSLLRTGGKHDAAASALWNPEVRSVPNHRFRERVAQLRQAFANSIKDRAVRS